MRAVTGRAMVYLMLREKLSMSRARMVRVSLFAMTILPLENDPDGGNFSDTLAGRNDGVSLHGAQATGRSRADVLFANLGCHLCRREERSGPYLGVRVPGGAFYPCCNSDGGVSSVDA